MKEASTFANRSTAEISSDSGFPHLKSHLIQHTGLAYYQDKDRDLAERVGRRLAVLEMEDCGSYLHLLRSDSGGEKEMDALVAELTIGETYFFRHQEQFDALREVILPELIERKKECRRIRIWSAGCATGPEPFSVAILLKQQFGHLLEGWEVTILGTDINRDFLAKAMAGKFDDWAFRGCPEELRRLCFTPSGKSWVLAEEYRKWIFFQYHNLVKNPFPSLVQNLTAFDLILCRNVMIYFNAELNRQLIGQFERTLAPEGWFLVGHAEPNMEFFQSFRTVSAPGATLYQKSAEQPSRPVACPMPDPAPEMASGPADLESFVRNIAIPRAPVPPDPEKISSSRDIQSIRYLANRGEWEKASVMCENLLRKDNLNPLAHFYQALVLEQLDFFEEAEKALKKAIYLDRNFVFAHYFIALCRQRQGDAAGAAKSFHNVRDLLSGMAPDRSFMEGDGITAAELGELTEMHLSVLRGP